MMQQIIEALKFIFPAYCANAVPVLAGGGLPLDFGKKFLDGEPIFGKNKTFKGFFFGLAVGTFVGFIEAMLFDYSSLQGFVLSLGALTGDLAGAFFKRRLKIKPGELLPLVDQLDFIVGALLFYLLIHPYYMRLELVILVFIITIPLHVLTNYAAYKIGLKKSPW
jgi:CDP-2,3-bis-(O-geranylgeranyl)-sn-glycerol synthase